MLFRNKTIKEIIKRERRAWALGHAHRLLMWDIETYMPEKGVEERSLVNAELSLMSQELFLALKPLIKKAARAKGLNLYEHAAVREYKRGLDYYTKLPPKLIERFNKASSLSMVAWRHARQKSDFSIFKPHLETMVELSKEKAERLGYKGNIYDALLDLNEEEFTVKDGDAMFSRLVPPLKKLLKRVLDEGEFPRTHPLERVRYDIDAQRKINEQLIKMFSMPMDRFRMDVSAHPFTINISANDERMTTRYEGTDFKASVYSTVHEMGHSIYDLNIDQRFEQTPLHEGASTGIHESQSRFWENMIGRSRQFTGLIYPLIRKYHKFTTGYTRDDLYRYFNSVRPSLIRVDADEITYNFHIALRYEIEKRLMNGELSVSDLPSYWNDMMADYVGIRPKRDSEGVLQDVHWCEGMFGYFPAYCIGNIVAGMTLEKAKKHFGSAFWPNVSKGHMGPIKDWLKVDIQKWGATYTPKELQKVCFKRAYDPEPFIGYLREKYLV